MNPLNITLETLLTAEGESARGWAMRFSYAQNHLDREKAIRNLLDYCCNELEKNKHLKAEHDKSEDELTVEIVSQLSLLKIEAAHDKQQGGHCDILVNGPGGFVWVAEAKKHTNYAWLSKGYKQLSTRYSTGVYGQDTGDVIVYCWNRSSASMLENWRQRVSELVPDISLDEKIDMDHLEFHSFHPHVATERDFRVRHKVVSLHFEPED